MCVYVCGHTYDMWRSEDNFEELVLFLHHVGSGNGTLAIRLDGRHLYLLSNLSLGLLPAIFNKNCTKIERQGGTCL